MEVLATCHVHSEWSYDARWTLDALAAKFNDRGSRVLLMTEHDRGFTPARLAQYRAACAKASSDKVLVVPGIEYSDAANRVHVLVWGPVPFLGEDLPTGEMLERVEAAGGLAVLAHPSRRDVWKSFQPDWERRLLGIECWNRKYDGWAPSRTAPELLARAGAVSFVGLDFHTDRQTFPLVMALDLAKDHEVSEAAVLDCLRNRRCAARAFGVPLAETLVRTATPLLTVAEKGRRMLASAVRSARNRAARPKRSGAAAEPPVAR